MTLEQAKDRINELKPKIEYYTRKYYEDEQVISDFEFDMLMKELKIKENITEELKEKDQMKLRKNFQTTILT